MAGHGIRMLARALAVSSVLFATSNVRAADYTLYNISYDPTRELYQEINTAFTQAYKAQTKATVTVRNSHGGSGGRRERSSTAARGMW